MTTLSPLDARLARGSACLRALIAIVLVSCVTVCASDLRAQTETDDCLGCHDDPKMRSEDGRLVGIPAKFFAKSIHADLDCIDCHSAPGDYEDVPHYAKYTPVQCDDCHDSDPLDMLRKSVHADLIDDGDMTCTSCHLIHEREGDARTDHGCGNECHEDEEHDYEASIHLAGRRGIGERPTSCGGCHNGHHVIAVSDTTSPLNPRNIPALCGKCHGDEPVVTKDYVRLPVSLPGYLKSVHGHGRRNGKKTAVCTSCHGTHAIRTAGDPASSTNKRHIAETCGHCHVEIAKEYEASVHGKAVAIGVHDAPTCTDCHDEHWIKPPSDPTARANPALRAKEICGNCHTNPDMVSKYGIQAGVVASYLDSYHNWAMEGGQRLAATCVDCHNVHEIRSPMDPLSSINSANVVATCGRCHKNSNAAFASSYDHASALAARSVHGWVRLVYIALIAFVLGGMALHNFIVARFELLGHFRRKRREPYVVRWRRAERGQHLVLLLSFACLAITGFALRFPESWWVELIGLGGREVVRGTLHRVFATILVAAALYHIVWVTMTRRGRWSIREMAPRYWDVAQFIQNMSYHLGLRKERPAFRAFDYTQKAEYWAVVWGTMVMGLTGFVMWWPTIATGWAPSWVVRVSEVIHFYEAILAVSAIFIWHFFYVIFMPSEYPMSTVWLNGRMSAEEWQETHRRQYEDMGDSAVEGPEKKDDAPG